MNARPYRRAHSVVAAELAQQADGGAVKVIPNGVETGLFSPDNADPSLTGSLKTSGQFLVSFIGTLGLAHGLDTLVVEAAGFGGQAGVTERLDNYPGFPEGIGGGEFADRLTVINSWFVARFGTGLTL